MKSSKLYIQWLFALSQECFTVYKIQIVKVSAGIMSGGRRSLFDYSYNVEALCNYRPHLTCPVIEREQSELISGQQPVRDDSESGSVFGSVIRVRGDHGSDQIADAGCGRVQAGKVIRRVEVRSVVVQVNYVDCDPGESVLAGLQNDSIDTRHKYAVDRSSYRYHSSRSRSDVVNLCSSTSKSRDSQHYFKQ